jgi:hypothetical protein
MVRHYKPNGRSPQGTNAAAPRWSTADMIVLRHEWRRGLSASQIGAQLGRGRGAIASKVRKLGLTLGPQERRARIIEGGRKGRAQQLAQTGAP